MQARLAPLPFKGEAGIYVVTVMLNLSHYSVETFLLATGSLRICVKTENVFLTVANSGWSQC